MDVMRLTYLGLGVAMGAVSIYTAVVNKEPFGWWLLPACLIPLCIGAFNIRV